MDDAVLERMVSQYQNFIFSICYHIVQDYFDAQDLTQETFLTAYRNLSSFDGQNEKAWLTRIATNKCLDYRRQAARRLIPTDDTLLHEYSDSPLNHTSSPESSSVESYCLEREIKKQLYEACTSLRPPYNSVALDYFCQERTVEEIARQQGKNKKTIQTQIYRARNLLRKYYRKEVDSG